MLFATGPTSTFNPYLLSGLTIPVYVYALISILVTLALLGGTSHMVVAELSVVDQVTALDEKTSSLQTNQEVQRRNLLDIQNKISQVDESVDRTGSKLSAELNSQGDALKKSWEAGHKAIDDKTSRLQANQESQQMVLKDVQSKISEVDENLELTGKKLTEELTSQGEAIKQTVEAGDQNQQKLIDGVQGRMFFVDESLNDVKKKLGEQVELMKTMDTNVAKNVNSQLTDVKETLAKLESTDGKTVAAIAKQRDEIDEIRQKLERLEASLVTPKSMLKSNSNVEDVKGIGPNKAAELKDIGITSASELIMADPKVVATGMGSTEKTVEKLQGRAQLQMIPGIKEKDLLLLEDLDITDRKKLSSQDPIDLGKKINAIFKVNLANGKVAENDRPTIEEVESWIKFTKA
jgi:predicted flap endonuclease-1-like 5' DNA nuclease